MRQLTIERTAALILFALLFAMAARIPVDTDVWWHIRSGEHTLTQGMIYADPFSYTRAGEPWINHSWGSQVVLYGIWQAAGHFGLAVFTAGLATAGMYFVYRASPGNVYLKAFAVVLGAATAAVFWSPRPQMFSFFFTALLLAILHLHKREGRDFLWSIPLLMAVWGNLHAGFAIGFIVLFGSIVGEVLGNLLHPKREHAVSWAGVRKLILVTVISVGAVVINPYGLQMLTVPFQTIGIGALQNFIQEWNTPNFHERQNWPFIFLLLGVLGAVGASRRRLDWTDYLLTAGTAFMGLLAGRNVATFALVATPVLTSHLDDMLTAKGWVLTPVRRVTPRMARINAVLLGLILLGAAAKVLLVLDAQSVDEAQRQFLPVAAVEAVQESLPEGPVFNSYNWGGYMVWALPQVKVFVDGRTDLYGDAFLTGDYVPAASGSPKWQAIFEQYGIRWAFIEANSGLANALRAETGWQVRYEDELAVIFVYEAEPSG